MMHLSRGGWTLLGTVALGLAVLSSCTKIGADDPARHRPVAVGDDQPIIIAGGSMNFIAPSGYAFVADTSTRSLRYAAPAGTVIRRVTVIDPGDVKNKFDIVAGQDPNIRITYDKGKCGAGNDPEIVAIAAPNGTDLTITSDTNDMSAANSNSDRFWSHKKKHKSISQVQVGANTIQCGNYGECSVVLHYCPAIATGCTFYH
jgi:hypothetical protein